KMTLGCRHIHGGTAHDRRGCGGLLRGMTIMKRIALVVLGAAVLAIGLTFALAPARAFTMMFDENGGCQIIVGSGSCSGGSGSVAFSAGGDGLPNLPAQFGTRRPASAQA